MGSNLFSQPLQYITFKTNLIDPINFGIDIPVSKLYSIDFNFSVFSYKSPFIVDEHNSFNARLNVRRDFQFKSYIKQKVAKFMYLGLRTREKTYWQNTSLYYTEKKALFKGTYCSAGLGLKSRFAQIWLDVDYLIFMNSNYFNELDKVTKNIIRSSKWKPDWTVSVGLAINLKNHNIEDF